MIRKFGMCKGRHEMPVNKYIFGYTIRHPSNVKRLDALVEKKFQQLNIMPYDEILLYTTGLKVALISIINYCKKNNRRKTFTNHGIYCGSKFAVHAITESIREEVADKNVRIIVIAPGVVETNLLSHTTDENIKSDYIEWKKSI